MKLAPGVHRQSRVTAAPQRPKQGWTLVVQPLSRRKGKVSRLQHRAPKLCDYTLAYAACLVKLSAVVVVVVMAQRCSTWVHSTATAGQDCKQSRSLWPRCLTAVSYQALCPTVESVVYTTDCVGRFVYAEIA